MFRIPTRKLPVYKSNDNVILDENISRMKISVSEH